MSRHGDTVTHKK